MDGILNPGGETETALRKIASGGAEESIPIPRRKPARLDATGRMIREDQPKTYKYLDRVPKPKTDLFKGSRAQEWEDWNALLEQDKELGSAQRKAFSEIYAFEGGMRSPAGGTAFAGIVQSTLDDQGYTLLGTIGDDEIATAFADSVFRNNPGTVIEAINKTLSTNMVNDFTAGTLTFNNLRSIAKDPKNKRVFLNILGNLRDDEFSEPGDKSRHEHYRFKK